MCLHWRRSGTVTSLHNACFESSMITQSTVVTSDSCGVINRVLQQCSSCNGLTSPAGPAGSAQPSADLLGPS